MGEMVGKVVRGDGVVRACAHVGTSATGGNVGAGSEGTDVRVGEGGSDRVVIDGGVRKRRRAGELRGRFGGGTVLMQLTVRGGGGKHRGGA